MFSHVSVVINSQQRESALLWFIVAVPLTPAAGYRRPHSAPYA